MAKLSGPEEAFLTDVLMDGAACNSLEAVHKIVTAQVKASGQGVHGQVLLQMPGDIPEDFLYFGVNLIASGVDAGVPADIPVYVDQELLTEGVGHT